MNLSDFCTVTEYNIGFCIFERREVKIQARKQKDDTYKWVVFVDGWVLGKDNDYHYEFMPSSRDATFIELTRFDTPEEAYSFFANLPQNEIAD